MSSANLTESTSPRSAAVTRLIADALVEGSGAVIMFSTFAAAATKGREDRSVPVPEFVLDELSVQCQRKAAGDLVFGGRNGGYLQRSKSSTGGSPGQSRLPVCKRSPRTICAIPAHRWRCRLG